MTMSSVNRETDNNVDSGGGGTISSSGGGAISIILGGDSGCVVSMFLGDPRSLFLL